MYVHNYSENFHTPENNLMKTWNYREEVLRNEIRYFKIKLAAGMYVRHMD